MYCKHCGKQIAPNAKFCRVCGEMQDPIEHTENNIMTDKSDITHKAITAYLKQVLDLEAAAKHLREKMNNTQKQITEISKWSKGNDIEKPPAICFAPSKPIKPDNKLATPLDSLKFAFSKLAPLSIILLIASGIIGANIDNVKGSKDSGTELLGLILVPLIVFIVYLLIIWLILFIGRLSDNSDKNAVYNAEMAEFSRKMEIYRHEVEMDQMNQNMYNNLLKMRSAEAEEKVQPLTVLSDKMAMDYNKLENLLNRTYSLNIIPQKYRSLTPVYFLYEYMSTSKQSFDHALFQCQLDKLESQLREVIETNYISIVQNAVIIAQGKQSLKNQEEMLYNQALSLEYDKRAEEQRESISNQLNDIYLEARRTADNSEESLKWNRAAALNSEQAAFFSAYNYFK